MLTAGARVGGGDAPMDLVGPVREPTTTHSSAAVTLSATPSQSVPAEVVRPGRRSGEGTRARAKPKWCAST